MKKPKCKLTSCLLCDIINKVGVCSMDVPIAIPKLKPNEIKCPFYSTSMKEDMEWVKRQGGIWNIIRKNAGEFTEEEIQKAKKKRQKHKKRKEDTCTS